MRCPNCSDQMQITQRYDIEIDFCSSCKGMWLDRGEIDKIIKIQSRYDGEEYNRNYHRKSEYDDDDDYDDDKYYYNRRRKRGGFLGDLF
ncbi:MAG TPA: zf-TFIIB domain-containing protein, partial [Nitrososphaeraceae archaeon]